MKRLYEVLGCRIEVSADFDWTEKRNLKPFISIGTPDFFLTFKRGVCSRKAELERMGKVKWIEELLDKQTHQWVRLFAWESDTEAVVSQVDETHWIGELAENSFCKLTKMDILSFIPIERFINQKQGLILHSALVNWDGKGLIFTGPSGIGKSTQASLWERYRQAKILNGDKGGIRKEGEEWLAYGFPYAGSSQIFINESVPIKAIVVLRQAKQNQIKKLSPIEAFAKIYEESTIINWDRKFVETHSIVIQKLVEEVPVYQLECTPDEEAIKMLEKRIEELK